MSLPLEYTVQLPNGKSYQQPLGLFINNEFVKSQSGKTFDLINPETGEVNGAVYEADAADIDIAVDAASEAFKSWRKVRGDKRGKMLFKLADLMDQERELLLAIEAWDSGKPRSQNALGDVIASAQCIRYFAGWADKVQGRVIQNDPKKLAYTIHEPFGVCGQIIPWNYPIAMAAWKIGPALAAGNTVVMKTSEITPLLMLYMCTLMKRAGFPPGVFNLVLGFGATAGKALAEHMKVQKIAFTGSTATGQAIQRAAASNMKAVTLECGGKLPLIIREDADLDQAVKWAAIGIMLNQGQICTLTLRIYVHEKIYEEFLTQYAAHVKENYKQGSTFADDVVVGPQVLKQQQQKVLGYIEVGKKEGARVVLGGEANTDGAMAKGFYVKPTIFADVKPLMRIVQEEIFGPVVSVGKFSSDAEALELANSTEYGLGAAIFTRDLVAAHQMAADIEAGMVWINLSNDSDHHIPFGGVKMLGVGRELGEYGLSIYTQAKAVHVNMGLKL